MHIKSAIDFVLIFFCFVLFCRIIEFLCTVRGEQVACRVLWIFYYCYCCDGGVIENSPKAIAIYHQIDVIVWIVLRPDWKRVLWLNLSRVREWSNLS